MKIEDKITFEFDIFIIYLLDIRNFGSYKLEYITWNITLIYPTSSTELSD